MARKIKEAPDYSGMHKYYLGMAVLFLICSIYTILYYSTWNILHASSLTHASWNQPSPQTLSVRTNATKKAPSFINFTPTTIRSLSASAIRHLGTWLMERTTRTRKSKLVT